MDPPRKGEPDEQPSLLLVAGFPELAKLWQIWRKQKLQVGTHMLKVLGQDQTTSLDPQFLPPNSSKEEGHASVPSQVK